MDYYSWIQKSIFGDLALTCFSYRPLELMEPSVTLLPKSWKRHMSVFGKWVTLRGQWNSDTGGGHLLLVLFQTSGSQSVILWPAVRAPRGNLSEMHIQGPYSDLPNQPLEVGVRKLFFFIFQTFWGLIIYFNFGCIGSSLWCTGSSYWHAGS